MYAVNVVENSWLFYKPNEIEWVYQILNQINTIWAIWNCYKNWWKHSIRNLFWLIVLLTGGVKIVGPFKLKFVVKATNKAHVTLGNVCDVARNCFSAPNDFKVKVLWHVKDFCIELYTDKGQYIKKQFPI